MANKPKTKPQTEADEEVKDEAVETDEAKAEEVKTEEPKATKKPKEEKEAKPKMYVGPTITGVGIQNRVYTEIPEGAAALIKTTPEFGNLFIDIEEYSKANRMLRERNGYIYNAFQLALNIKNNKA